MATGSVCEQSFTHRKAAARAKPKLGLCAIWVTRPTILLSRGAANGPAGGLSVIGSEALSPLRGSPNLFYRHPGNAKPPSGLSSGRYFAAG